MSVLNQVLHSLEKRGAAPLSNDAAIRVVPSHNNGHVLWMLVGVVLLILVWAGVWHNTTPQSEPQTQSLPVAAPTIAAPIAEASEITISPEKRQTPDVKTVSPAMRLSYELSAIPKMVRLTPKLEPKLNSNQKIVKVSKLESAPKSIEHTATIEKQMKQLSPQQRAENEFRRATELLQKGRDGEALDAYASALKLDGANDSARLAMVWLLLGNKHNDDAEQALQDGLNINIKNVEFATLMARLQVERDNLPLAIETLEKTLPYAGQQAEYHAFIAAVYQRLNQHNEAITHYQIAVMQTPNSGLWLMGLGVSLHEVQRNEEARAAFKNALETHTLSAELQAFVEQRLKELG